MIAHGHLRLRTLCSPGKNLALAYLCTIPMLDQAGRGLIRSLCRCRQQQLTISSAGNDVLRPLRTETFNALQASRAARSGCPGQRWEQRHGG